ncbi:ATP-dependent helicase/DNAse subunit B [Caloramator quimbayensis]|uniref:ATP-dependent helicase/DNAse subunit B n=1 Tax=Caloramator quimbayensis TaxID=1147123 RepID=A0A1T4WSA2_9CLOT|nr:PD-(D/E)XK nuclease family protein [Caloramator quimbayensis]SKA79728.1 ATP-dependent helicase/DNAse subunit B [Caloramator quimbayensis]
MFEKIINSVKGNKRVIYLAPTRELIEFVRGEIISRLGSLYNVDVITFDDLSRRISKNQFSSYELISYEASLVLVEEILKEQKDNIKYFNKVYNKKGFAVNALNAIRSLKKEYVDINEFKNMINSIGDDVLKRKTEDLVTIYTSYKEKLNSLNLLDMDDVIKIAIENVDKTTYFENVSLFIIDGYIDIFKTEKKLLEAIKNNFSEIEFIYHIPLNVPYVLNFAEKEALGFLKELKFEINDDDFLNTKYRYLAETLFTDRALDETFDVKMLDAPCIEDEVRQVASNIKELYKEKRIELDKIAVIVPDREEYEDMLLEVFNEYGIYISLSDTELLSKIPFIKTIMALLRLKNERYNKNLLEDIVASPYLSISEGYDVLRVLERYFKGKDTSAFLEKLLEEFKVKNEDEEQQREYTEKIPKLRESYVKFENMIDEKLLKIKYNASFEEYKNAVINILDELDIKKRIICLYKKAKGKISQDIMLRDLKALFGFIELLNNLDEVYKHQTSEIDYSEFLNILDENITAATVTLSPKRSYGVKVLTPDLIRGTSYDYVFIMGLNEGKFPKLSKASGIYTTKEKEIIYRQGVNFGSSIFEMEKEKIRFIMSIASSKEGLFLSYRTSGEDGSYISKSQFLDEVIYKLGLKKQFEERKVRTMRDRFSLNKIYSKDEIVKRYCITKDNKIKENFKEAACFDTAIKIEELRNSSNFTEYDGLIDINKMKDSNKRDVFSASKIMSYNKCPFKHFIEDVLSIRKWEDDVYSNLNFGNIYHYVLENYYKDYIGKELEYKEDKIEGLANEAFENYGLVLDDNFTGITKEQLLKNIKNFIKVDVEYKNEIKFRPYFIEKEFELDDLIQGIKIKGRIDRVDMEYDGDNPTGRYIIQDYKISNAKALGDMLKGEAIQVVLYYYVVNSILKDVLEKTPECLALVYYDINATIENNNKKISGIIVAKDKDELKTLKTHHQTRTVARENFDVVLTHITENFIKDSIENIKKAVFTLTKICEIQSAFNLSCDYEDVCRYNKLRLLNKCEVEI